MPILLYCALEPASLPPLHGVGNAPLAMAQVGALQVLYSEVDPGRLSSAVREAAMEFHRVISSVFQSRAVLSFRFPTLFASPEEMIAELAGKGPAMAQFLRENSDFVQMELRLSSDAPAAGGAASGTEYLQRRRDSSQQLEAAASSCQSAAAGYLRAWRRRSTPAGLHCYALVARAQVGAYREAMSSVRLPPGVRALLSGPWPANDFLEPSA